MSSMGLGTLGWQRDGIDGPNPFSAWSLEELGWASLDNDRLIEVRRDTTGLRIADLYEGGAIVKVPLGMERNGALFYPHYLLLEYRSATSHHYNRHQPDSVSGLLVWHVRYANSWI